MAVGTFLEVVHAMGIHLRATGLGLKHPGPLPKPTKLKGKGPSASEQVLTDRE